MTVLEKVVWFVVMVWTVLCVIISVVAGLGGDSYSFAGAAYFAGVLYYLAKYYESKE